MQAEIAYSRTKHKQTIIKKYLCPLLLSAWCLWSLIDRNHSIDWRVSYTLWRISDNFFFMILIKKYQYHALCACVCTGTCFKRALQTCHTNANTRRTMSTSARHAQASRRTKMEVFHISLLLNLCCHLCSTWCCTSSYVYPFPFAFVSNYLSTSLGKTFGCKSFTHFILDI